MLVALNEHYRSSEMRIREAKDEAAVVGPKAEKMPSIEVDHEVGEEVKERVVANGVAVLNGGHEGFCRNGDFGERRKSGTPNPVVEDHPHQKTGPTTTLLLQLAANNNNNKENGDTSATTKAKPLLEVFQATVVESNGGGGNGVFYERRVDDVIVVDADKRLFYCVRDAIGK